MPWNGSGVFTRDYNWVNDRDAAIDITASRMDAEFDNYATGIQACIAKNGENAATGNLPMGTFKHTGVGASSARTDYTRVAEYVDGAHVAADAGGTANAQTLTLSPAITAYVKYQSFRFIPVSDNTGACTLNVNGVGNKSIKLFNGSDVTSGDLNANGVSDVVYDGTNFVLINPSSSASLVSAGVQLTTSGTTVDFSSIPSWVKRISILFDGVTCATNFKLEVTIGDSGGLEATGYKCTNLAFSSASGTTIPVTTSFLVSNITIANYTVGGIMTIDLLDNSTFTWAMSGNISVYDATTEAIRINAGSKSLSSTLDRLRITSSQTFTAGKVNILYQ